VLLKWYFSLAFFSDYLIAAANIPRTKEHCKPKNYPFIFHPDRLLVDGKPVVGIIGIYCLLRCRWEAVQRN
jgi:hypothetical protein